VTAHPAAPPLLFAQRKLVTVVLQAMHRVITLAWRAGLPAASMRRLLDSIGTGAEFAMPTAK
jgi:hypothetical protein